MKIQLCGQRILSVIIACCIFAGLSIYLPIEAFAQSSSTTIDLYDEATTSGTGWSYNTSTQEFAITGNITVVGEESHSFNRRFVISGGSADAPLQVKFSNAHITGTAPIMITPGSHVMFVLEGANYFLSGMIDADDADITISGNGHMQVLGIACKTLTLVGGQLYANGWAEPAIDGDVRVTGGWLSAFSSSADGISGSLTLDGDAIVITGGVGGSQAVISGILFDNASASYYGNGIVYGAATAVEGFSMNQDYGLLTVSDGAKLTIPSGRQFYINDGKTIINNGTIVNNGKIVNNGTITNNGTISNSGVVAGDGTITGNAVAGNGNAVEWQRPLIFSVDEGKFYIDGSGDTVYSEQSDRWEWNAATNTLTLKNFEWKTAASQAMIVSDLDSKGLTLNLIGNNTLSTNDTNNSNYGLVYSRQSYYKTEVPLRIKGSGTLNISVGDTVIGECIALDAGALIIESGTLNITAGKGGNTIPGDSVGASVYSLRADGGAVNVICDGSDGIFCENDFVINRGSVTVQSGNAKDNSCGIYAGGRMNMAGGTLAVKSGNVTSPIGSSRALVVRELTMTGGKVDAVAGKAPEASLGVFVVGPMQLGAWGDLHISGGELNATSDISEIESIGVLIRGSLIADGGAVRAIAERTFEGEGSTGILLQAPRNIAFSRGSIVAQGANAAIRDYDVDINEFTAIAINITAKSYRYWTNTVDQAPNDAGISYPESSAFENSDEYKYIRLESTESSNSGSSSGGGGGSSDKTAYTVAFETNGGSAISNKKIEKGKKAAKPSDPTKEGYVFAGWYSDAGFKTEYDFDEGVTSNITIYAKWTENKSELPPSTIWQNPFSDVRKSDWFYNSVEYSAENGLFKGIGETEFGPNLPMTRAMIITVLARYAGVDVTGGETWYSKAVEWGIMNGITDGSDLEGNVTREQLAALLWRFAKQPSGTGELSEFTDSASVSDWAEEALKWANGANLINGYPDGTLNPQGNATRAEVAAIIYRFVELAE